MYKRDLTNCLAEYAARKGQIRKLLKNSSNRMQHLQEIANRPEIAALPEEALLPINVINEINAIKQQPGKQKKLTAKLLANEIKIDYVALAEQNRVINKNESRIYRLPLEILREIFRHLASSDIARLGRVSTFFNQLVRNEAIWLKFINEQVSSAPRLKNNESYQAYYYRYKGLLKGLNVHVKIYHEDLIIIVPLYQCLLVDTEYNGGGYSNDYSGEYYYKYHAIIRMILEDNQDILLDFLLANMLVDFNQKSVHAILKNIINKFIKMAAITSHKCLQVIIKFLNQTNNADLKQTALTNNSEHCLAAVLNLAIDKQQNDSVIALIEFGANIRATSIEVACNNNPANWDMLNTLITTYPAVLKSIQGLAPHLTKALYLAIKHKQHNSAKILLEFGVDITEIIADWVPFPDSEGGSRDTVCCLLATFETENWDMVNSLITTYPAADILQNIFIIFGIGPKHPHPTVGKSHCKFYQEQYEKGLIQIIKQCPTLFADPNQTMEMLKSLIKYNMLKVLDSILSNKEINLPLNINQLLSYAIFMDNYHAACFLLQKGASPNFNDDHGNISLHWLCAKKSIVDDQCELLVSELMKYHVQIDAVNLQNQTPLELAIINKNLALTIALVKHGATITDKALELAESSNRITSILQMGLTIRQQQEEISRLQAVNSNKNTVAKQGIFSVVDNKHANNMTAEQLQDLREKRCEYFKTK